MKTLKIVFFELAETCKLAIKSIVILSTDANPLFWAGQYKRYGDLKQMCGFSGQGKMFVDIGQIWSRPGWDELRSGTFTNSRKSVVSEH